MSLQTWDETAPNQDDFLRVLASERVRNAARALVVEHADLRGTTSASAPPGLMNLIGSVDDDDLAAMEAAAIQIADECAAEADDEHWRLDVAANEPELHALLAAIGR
jgi:hypothetical protein